MDPEPELFVARDRARRLAWRLEKVLQERRLAWRGEAIGMATVRDDADLELAALAADARGSAADVVRGLLRDRERGYMEVPFAVAMETVADHLERAAALEADRRALRTPDVPARRAVEDLLGAAARRLEAFQATYDAKQPLPPATPTDVGRLLALATPPGAPAPDRTPPSVATDGSGLGDLLLAVRRHLGAGAGGWRVAGGGVPGRLVLALGEPGEARAAGVPEAVERAARVLAWLHPVQVAALVRARALGGDAVVGLSVTLEGALGGLLEPTVAALSGGEAPLGPEAHRAVQALLAAPPLPREGPVPAARLVALLGVLGALDRALEQDLRPRFTTGAVRNAALDLPREPTRRAPLRARLLEALQAEHPEVPVANAGELADLLTVGRKLGRRSPSDLAVLLVLFGRVWSHAGARGTVAIDRGPLTDDDVAALARDLAVGGALRKALEGGRPLPPADATRLECAAIGALGRLARLGGPRAGPVRRGPSPT